MVPQNSMTGRPAGVGPHTGDAGILEALHPNRGSNGEVRGSRFTNVYVPTRQRLRWLKLEKVETH